MLVGRPLKAQAVAIGIGDGQLPHAVRTHHRLVHLEAMRAEQPVRPVQILATEVQPGIGVCGYAGGVGSRRPLAVLVRGIEHQLHAVEPEQRPVEVVSRPRCGDDLEPQHVAVEMDRCRHIEDL